MKGTGYIQILALVIIQALSSSMVFGQQEGEIILDNETKREVAPAFRLTEQPKILDTVFPVPKVQFPLLAMNYEPFLEVKPIEPATVNMVAKLPQLYNGYAKIGIGSVTMPLAEVYYNNTRTRKFNYGGHVQHLSSFGGNRNLAPSNFDRTNVRAFGGVNEKKYDWSAEANYNNRGFHYYGFPNENANADSISQRFHTTDIKANYLSHQHDSLGINWKIGAHYRNLTVKKPFVDSLADWRTKENSFTLSGGAWFRWGNELFAADADIQYNGYKYGVADSAISIVDTGIVSNNTVVSLRPSITTYSKDSRLKATFGADVTLNAGLNMKVYIYPAISVKYSLFDDILIPYIGLRGGMTQQSLHRLSTTNEFMITNVQLRNEHKAIEVYGGMKGTLSRRISFNLFAAFGNVKDKALFVLDTNYSSGNKFAVKYDTMNVAQIEGGLSYQLLEKTKIDAIGRFYSYQLRNNAFAWNLPQVQVILRGTHNLYDKFLFHVDVLMETGRRTQVYSPMAGVVEQDGQYAKSLGVIVDANLGVEYRYNKRVSAFIQFNNFAAQRYKRWYNYPVQGFQVLGGVTFRF